VKWNGLVKPQIAVDQTDRDLLGDGDVMAVTVTLRGWGFLYIHLAGESSRLRRLLKAFLWPLPIASGLMSPWVPVRRMIAGAGDEISLIVPCDRVLNIHYINLFGWARYRFDASAYVKSHALISHPSADDVVVRIPSADFSGINISARLNATALLRKAVSPKCPAILPMPGMHLERGEISPSVRHISYDHYIKSKKPQEGSE